MDNKIAKIRNGKFDFMGPLRNCAQHQWLPFPLEANMFLNMRLSYVSRFPSNASSKWQERLT